MHVFSTLRRQWAPSPPLIYFPWHHLMQHGISKFRSLCCSGDCSPVCQPYAETVRVAPGGELYMADKRGYMWRAVEGHMDARPLAHLGPGRPLGFDFDSAGNVYIAMAGAVGN